MNDALGGCSETLRLIVTVNVFQTVTQAFQHLISVLGRPDLFDKIRIEAKFRYLCQNFEMCLAIIG